MKKILRLIFLVLTIREIALEAAETILLGQTVDRCLARGMFTAPKGPGEATRVRAAFDETFGAFTRDVQFSELSVISGEYRFVLDIAEPGSGSLLSLDGLKLFATSTPGQNTTNVNSLGTLLYDLDAAEAYEDSVAAARRAEDEAEEEGAAVATLHDVVPPLGAEPAGRLDGRLAAVFVQVVDLVDLGADELVLEVGVDHAGGLGRLPAGADRPGADLLLAGREVRLKAEQLVTGTDHAVESGLFQAEVRQKQLLVLAI